MARAGIYKSEVLRARDKLRALGRYPSIDAIRTELGNTGSKGTIHRYLKEIEEDEGGASGTKVGVSEALQDLVASLASRLQEEADVRVCEAETKHAAQSQVRAQALTAMTQERDGFRAQLERHELTLADERSKNDQATATIRAQAIELAQLTQQVKDLQDRVAAEERNRQSLEEKHQHARDALEHFRWIASIILAG
ncbi:DNA-binding protein [Aquabacterium sp.]|uniref:DNA-binding protein n=1 Tax=Aquabacterium sp. TaxID=1872578 RepID=UPI0019AC6DDB|nr:DNA-binding protein [Aquabacterium sp.]MBC7701785.1 DNA-binding protein [Aquabacterium sp.]